MTRTKAYFIAIVALVVAAQTWPGPGRAGDQMSTAEEPTNDISLSPDSLIPREDWKRRVDDARKRAEQARRDWRLNAPRRMVEPDPPGADSHPARAERRHVAARGYRLDRQGVLAVSR